jgi:hypothetical protein
VRKFINESEMALFPECMESCAQKVVDTADIVRDAILRQLSCVQLRGGESRSPKGDSFLFANPLGGSIQVCTFMGKAFK